MQCSSCHHAEARDGQRTCAGCHAEYMRWYRKTAQRRVLEKAYRRGLEALRADLLQHFQRIGKGEMTGYTAAEIVKNSAAIVARGTST
jgi:hypothetical protein